MYWKEVLKDAPKPWVITFICTGNIMRSPYAEFMAKKIVSELKEGQSIRGKLSFKSGAVKHQNSDIHPLTEKFLKEEGIGRNHSRTHKARLVDNFPEYFSDTDLFITMTGEHKTILAEKGYNNSYMLSEVANKGQEDILDPYSFPEKDKEIYLKLKEYTKSFVNELVKL